MAKDLAIVLNNGTVNSAVVTALAAQKFRPVMAYVEAGASHRPRLRAAYDGQAAHFKPYRQHTLAMPFLSETEPARPAGAAGAAAADAPVSDPLGPHLVELLPLVSAATWLAARYGAAAVYLGLRVGNQGDELAGATEYLQVWNELIQMPGGLGELEVVAPLLELEAWQVVDLGFQVAAPLERTWSCLADGPELCGACRGCRDREAAFQQAAKADPVRRGGR